MSNYIISDANGYIVRIESQDEPPVEEGMTVTEWAGASPWAQAHRGSDSLMLVDGIPVWSDTRTLESAKATKSAEITAARATANSTSFPFLGKHIAVDDMSMKDIQTTNGKVIRNGTMPGGWPGGWKTIDNSYVAIPDAATWYAFYDAMFDQGAANFAHSQALKATLAAATSLSQVDEIQW